MSGQYTKRGPGRRPRNNRPVARRAPFYGPGSLMEYDRKISAWLRGEGEKPTRREAAA